MAHYPLNRQLLLSGSLAGPGGLVGFTAFLLFFGGKDEFIERGEGRSSDESVFY